ncbi:MAG: hypothetical protein AAB875_06565 [Patescibacteria group bacterium]
MASLRDGLGGEELQISGLQAGGVSISPFIVGSLTTTDMVSGLNVYAAGSGTFGRINDVQGAHFAIVRNSGTSPTFGARIQFGSVVTGAEGFGSALFNTAFANTQYYWSATTGSTGGFLTVDAGSWAVTISGAAGRNISGVVFKGGASMPYYWIAIGL